jgi:hypothetical protein
MFIIIGLWLLYFDSLAMSYFVLIQVKDLKDNYKINNFLLLSLASYKSKTKLRGIILSLEIFS